MFKKVVKILVKLGVHEESNDSEWVFPSFTQPKAKTNQVRLLSNFLNLNSQLKLKPYPMPKIREMLLKFKNRYATSLDLNMGYSHIHLNKEASNLCNFILP